VESLSSGVKNQREAEQASGGWARGCGKLELATPVGPEREL